MNTIPYIPENAPFNEEQRAWLNGYLAGLFSEAGAAPAGAESVEAKKPLTILYGSQTGNAESLSKQTRKLAESKGFTAKVAALDEYDRSALAGEENLLVITSTYGEGDPPDNAQEFNDFILSDEAPALANTRFSVLGLGDTNYPDFCETAKTFDKRFAELGGQVVAPRVDCDVDFEEPYEQWVNAALDALSAGGASAAVAEPVEEVKEEEVAEAAYSRKNPFLAKVLVNDNLNKDGSAKETRHVEICLEGSGLEYGVGDALGVMPQNSEARATELIEVLGFTADATVSVDGTELTLLEALVQRMDFSKLTKPFAKACIPLAKKEGLAALLDDTAAFKDYLWGREIIDVLVDYEVGFATAQEFVDLLKPLAPRLYSISSSPKAHEGAVHVTVGRVTYESHGRKRAGVCSDFLAECADGASVGVYMQPNKHFVLPEDTSLPVIMVGPGTGIAPFRAFLEEREATQSPGKNWLFFGDQHAATDFLYQEQLADMQKGGTLSRLDVAFSRDQEEKIYVQDVMKKNAAELFAWMEEGAYFYVCGDASRMAKDVDAALLEVFVTGTGSAEAGEAYMKKIKKEKRYLRDVY